MPDFPTHSLLTELDPLSTPFEERPEVDLLLDLERRPVPGEWSRGGGRPVLVVDSTPIARKFLMRRLHELGYDAYGADHGEQALALIGTRAFAIVFTELGLTPDSGVDGLGLCQAIKSKPDHPNGIVPAVVVTTGRAGSSSRVQGSLAGCDAYLTKPLLEEQLLAALREVDPMFE